MMSVKRQRKKVESIADRKEAAKLKTKAEALELLQKRFDLPMLQAVIQRGSSDSSYELRLEDGRIIVLGGAYEIHQQAKVRARLFDANAVMKKYHSIEWDEVLKAIRSAVEQVETITESEELRAYVLGFIGKGRSHINPRDDFAKVNFNDEDKTYLLKALSNREYRTFYDSQTGVVYLAIGRFIEHLNMNSGRRWSRRDVATLLSRNGFV